MHKSGHNKWLVFYIGIIAISWMMIPSNNTVAVENPAEGLIFHVLFDEHLNAVQAGGKKEPVESFDYAPRFIAGMKDKAVLCGVGKEGVVYSTEGNLIAGSGTVAFWIALTGDAPFKGLYRTFFKCTMGDEGGYLMIYEHAQTGEMALVIYPGDKRQYGLFRKSKLEWRPGEFHHLCFTWHAKKARWYIDGMLMKETELPRAITNFDPTFRLGGKSYHPAPEKPDMLFDDLRIYNRPLSPAEVKLLAAMNMSEPTSAKTTMAALQIEPDRINIPYLAETAEDSLLQSGAMLTGFTDVGQLPYGKYSRNQTRVWLAWNEKGLHLLYKTGFAGGELKKLSERNDQYTGGEDVIEIFLQPDRSDRKTYYQFNLTGGGFQYDALGLDKSFNSGWTARTRLEGKEWIAQMFIPFTDIKIPAGDSGREIGLRLGRDWAGAQNYFVGWPLTPLGAAWHKPEDYAVGCLVKDQPVVQIKSVGDLWKGEAALQAVILNPGREPLPIKINYGIYENSGAGMFGAADSFSVPAHGRHETRVAISNATAGLSENGYYLARYDVETGSGEKLAQGVLPFVYDPQGKEKEVKAVRKLTGAELEKARKFAADTWLKEKVGEDHQVPPPFTPGRASKNTIEVYGRCYQFGEKGLLGQLINQGHEMLATPVNLVSIEGNKRISWKWQWDSFKNPYEDRHTIRGEGAGPGLKARVDVTVEFDGFARYDLIILPLEPGTTVSPLDLEIVIPAELAGLQSGIGDCMRPGFVPRQAGFPFVPVLWLGNEDIGLAWSAENQSGWLVNDFEKAMAIKRDEKNTRVLIHLFDHAAPISGERKICFALQGTPMRPLRNNWRYYGFYSIWPSDKVRADGWIYVQETRWWNYGFFSIKPYSVEYFARRIADTEQACVRNMKTGERVCPPDQMRIVTYSCPLTMNCSAYGEEFPEWAVFGQEWMLKPSRYSIARNIIVTNGASSTEDSQAAYLCPRSSFPDYRCWELQEWLKLAKAEYPRVRGMYWDLSDMKLCENAGHGCGYEVNGAHVAGWPTFALREYIKRLYKIGRRYDPDFIQIYHGFNAGGPASGFIDASLLGEQYRIAVQESYFDEVTPEETRILFIGRQFGWTPYFLPELGRPSDPRSRAEGPTEEMCALVFPLDTLICPIQCNQGVVKKYERVRYEFGMQDDVGFVGYWKKKTAARPDNKDVWMSAYLRPGKALLLISNPLKENVTTQFRLDREVLGFQPAAQVTARDAVANQPVEIKDDTFTLNLQGRRLRMILLEMFAQ